MDATHAVQAGLEGVVVAETRLSEVDGERGRLVIAGGDVESLAGTSSFEEVCARLWAPYAKEAPPTSLQAALGEARVRAFGLLEGLGDALEARDAMDALRAAAAHVPAHPGGERDTFLLLTGALAVFTGAWARLRRGLAPVRPDPALSHAADLLRMVSGELHPERAAGLEAYLVTVSDHGLNASTFTARVIASTGSDEVSAVVGAIGALKGPLHGGAPGPVLDMLDSIGQPERAASWLDAELRAGRRIMGMGHRIYRVRDPRAAVLERAIERLEQGGLRTDRLALARAVERAAEDLLRQRYPDRPLRANVEFYTAVLLDAVGLDRALFSAALRLWSRGRVAGPCRRAAGYRTADPARVSLRGVHAGLSGARHHLRLRLVEVTFDGASVSGRTDADDGGVRGFDPTPRVGDQSGASCAQRRLRT